MESKIRNLVPKIIPQAFYDIFPVELKQLAHNGDLILLFAIFFFGFYRLTHIVSKFIPQYVKLPPLKRRAWRSHLVSQLHALGVCYGAVNVILNPIHYNDVLFGRSDQAEFWFSYSAGFFFWDCYIVLRNYDGFLFGFHGTMCLLLNFAVMRPVYQFYGHIFLFFEVSTIFLNIHWFCDKMDMTGSSLQKINGYFLISSFFLIRIVYGSFHISRFVYINYMSWDVLPSGYPWFFFFAMATMQALNFLWFSKMVASVRSRKKPVQTFDGEVPQTLKME